MGGIALSRLIDKPITVQLKAGGQPLLFIYRGRRYRIVQVLEVWREAGEWWEGKGSRTVYRVATVGGGIFELDYRCDNLHDDCSGNSGRWFLYKAYD